MLLVLVTVSMPRVYVCRHGLDERLKTLAAKKNAKMLLHHTRTTSNHTRQLRKKVSESFAFAGLIASILLVIGAKKRKPALLISYVVYSVIAIFFMFVMFVFVIRGTIAIVSGFLLILLKFCFSCVVIQRYKQLNAEKQANKGQNSEAT